MGPRSVGRHALLATLALPSLLGSARVASADTYVKEPPLGRVVSSVDVYGGAPVAGASVGGRGADVGAGYAWESGWSLLSQFGAAQWSSRATPASALDDRTSALRELYGGLGVRLALLDGEYAPYVQANVLAEALQVQQGGAEANLRGGGVGGQLGVRWRDAPWDLWLGLDARRVRFAGGVDGIRDLSRVVLVLGATLDLGAR